ncbi:MAG: hypothetical protein IKJ59_13990 [Clostridia bacterium]|nr:hypothetical protein [Bacteroidales bacterium]MBR3919817.1 hypothetical protein [Clostridia bacterium]
MKRILYLIISTVYLFVSGCNGCQEEEKWWSDPIPIHGSGNFSTNTENSNEEPSSLKSVSSKEVPGGMSLAEYGRSVYSDLIDYEKYGLGGVKLCAEMSADREGKWFSSYPQNTKVTFRPPSDLHLHKIPIKEKSSNIICLLTQEIIDVKVGNVQSVPRTSSEQPAFTIGIKVENKRNDSVVCVIPLGQMIEVQAPNVQNVVVCNTYQDVLPPHQVRQFKVSAYCAAQKRESPSGYPAKLTPFVLTAPKHIYESQSKVWNFQRSAPKNDKIYTLTFYAWRIGTHVGANDHKSLTGHAFVDIPEIGPVGYGGTITNHTDLVKYADYKVNVKIDRNALQRVHNKYWEWKNNPPQYDLGRYDCTTFAMDIADAAGIYYGPRWAIQFPAGFLRSLNATQYLQKISSQLMTELRTYN